MIADDSGYVYVAGSMNGSFDGQTNSGGRDLCLTKFDADGNKQWTRLWGSSADDGAAAVGVDESGNVYVTGNTQGPFDGQSHSGISDFCLTKFDSDGNKQWTRIWGSSEYDAGAGVAVDGSGSVFVAGFASGSLDGQSFKGYWDFCLTKFDTNGNKQWTQLWGSEDIDYANGISADQSGCVYVAGVTGGSFDGQTNSGSRDFCLTKFDNDGNKQWTRLWGSTDMDYAGGVAEDGTGSVYVAGYTRGELDGQVNSGERDFCLTKFRDDGNREWVRIWGSENHDLGYDVSLDEFGSVYVAGSTRGTFGGQSNSGEDDLCLTMFNKYGGMQEVRIWGSAATDVGYGVSVDKTGSVYVTGLAGGAFDGQTFSGVGGDLCLTKWEDWFHEPVSLVSLLVEGYPIEIGTSSTYDYGTYVLLEQSDVTITLSADVIIDGLSRYTPFGWSGEGSVPASGWGNEVSFTITTDSTLTWNSSVEHFLDTESGEHGTVNVHDGWRDEGQLLQVQATAYPGWMFWRWFGDLESENTFDNPLVLSVKQPTKVIAVFTTTDDLDLDGMGDAWESTFFSTTDQDGSGDYDGDGMTDWEEWVAGTDPTNETSQLAIESVRSDAAGRFALSWSSATGKTYFVLGATNMQESQWSTLHTADGNGTPMVYTNRDDAAKLQFYRIGVNLP